MRRVNAASQNTSNQSNCLYMLSYQPSSVPFVTAVTMTERSLVVCGDPLFYTLLYDHLLSDGQSGAAVDRIEDGGQGKGQGQGHGLSRGMERGRMNIFLALQPRPQAEEYLRGKDPSLLHRHVRLMTRLYLPSVLPYFTLP
jgi:hypothetical protein